MSRDDFMRQLETLLEDVPQEEKQEALSYYQSYFEDAGAENEERILRELESPQRVAATIKADLGMGVGNGVGEYTEHGFTDSRFQDRQELNIRRGDFQGRTEDTAADGRLSHGENDPGHRNAYGKEGASDGREAFEHSGNPDFKSAYTNGEPFGFETMRGNGSHNPFGDSDRDGSSASYGNSYGNGSDASYGNSYGNGSNASYGGSYRNSSQSTYDGNQALKIILIVVIALLTSPVWLGVIGGIAGTVFGLAVAAVCVTISLFVAGGVMFGVGIGQMAAGSLGVGFALSGAGMLVLALAVLSTLLCIWVCGKLIPWLCRVVKGLWRGFFSRKEQRI